MDGQLYSHTLRPDAARAARASRTKGCVFVSVHDGKTPTQKHPTAHVPEANNRLKKLYSHCYATISYERFH